MFAEGRTVTQDWIDEWCQSGGASVWAERKENKSRDENNGRG